MIVGKLEQRTNESLARREVLTRSVYLFIYALCFTLTSAQALLVLNRSPFTSFIRGEAVKSF